MRNEKGITIIELLATIVIMTIISLLIFNIIVSGQKQHQHQTTTNFQIQDTSYLLKLITQDVRKSSSVTVVNANEFTYVNHHYNQIATYKYNPSDKSISRNNVIISNDIEQFTYTYTIDSNSIEFNIVNNRNKTYHTKLYFREGG